MSDRGPKERASKIIGASFALSALASVGLAIVYALGGWVQAEGALLGIALGGLSVGMIMWGKYLLPGGHYVEEREPHPSPGPERAAAEREFGEATAELERRSFLGKMLAAALAGLGVVALFPIRSLGDRPGGSLLRTAWEGGLRVVTFDNVPVRADDVGVGTVLTVFPEGNTHAGDAPALLLHVAPGDFVPVDGREDWSPQGFIAFSKLCTHAGCPVGLYERASQHLFCPCHQSVFDVRDGAAPIGGPATRPLPQLPLGIDEEGFLFARGDFSEPVGPGFWKRG